jgi:hypothetical protein
MNGKTLGHISKVELGFNDRDWLVLTFHLTTKQYIWWDEDNKVHHEYREGEELSESGTFTMWDALDDKFGKKLEKLMRQAKVNSLDKLKGTPIEVEWKDNIMVSWRVLEEVL